MKTYLYYKGKYDHLSLVVIMNEAERTLEFYPENRDLRREYVFWENYYINRRKNNMEGKLFKICENQFNKFKDSGFKTKPENWDFE